jgi:hypothetical protein
MLLTDAQIHEIREIIRDRHTAFIVNTIGPEAVAPEILKKLKAKGMVNIKISSVEESYLYGQVLSMLEDPKVSNMSYQEFKQHVRKNPVPLSDLEKRAIDIAKHQAGQFAVGLGNRVETATGNLLIEADSQLRARMREEIRTATAENIAKRETVKQLKSDLGWATKDWARDWDRIAITEKNTAMQRGSADQIAKEYGEDALVFKRPMPSACKHCKEHYLGPDGHPRIFKLSTLESFGTNVGKKAADWGPTIGSLHPFCFVEGTMVLTEHGEQHIQCVDPGTLVLSEDGNWNPVTHVWQSVYEGDVVKVTTPGFGEIIATADHPFKTELGWVAAKELKSDLNLFGFERNRKPLLITHLDSVDRPASLLENPCFAQILFGFSRAGVPVTAIDFNGKLYLREGEVDKTHIEVVTGGRFQTNSNERLIDHPFVCRFELTSLTSDNGLFETPGLLLSTDGIVKSGDVSPSLFWREFGHVDDAAFPMSSGSSASSFDSVGNGPSRYSELSGYFFYRHQLVEVHTKDGVNIQVSPVRSSFHGGHKPDEIRIVNVSRSYYRGLVYNLTVAESNSYVAEGHVVHNCGCQIQRIPPGWGFNDEGQIEPGAPHGEHVKDEATFARSLREEAKLRKAFKLQGHIDYQGIPIAIENKPGTKRNWTGGDGESGSTYMEWAYGYVKRTNGADEDDIDCFVGPDPRAQNVYIVHQQNPHTGQYDEDKVMIGFPNKKLAEAAYRIHYDRDDFAITTTPMELEQFKRWVSGTEPKRGEMFKSGKPIIPLVVPVQKKRTPVPPNPLLKKALKTVQVGKLPAYVGAAYSPAGGRAITGTGTGIYFNTPSRPVPPTDHAGLSETPREVIEGQRAQNASVRRDRETYHIPEPIKKAPKLVIPEKYQGETKREPTKGKEEKERLEKYVERNRPRPKNKVELEETQDD